MAQGTSGSILVSAIAAALAAVGGSAHAQSADRCSDVLNNGTFQTASYRDNAYFRQILTQRFLRSSYEDSKKNKTLGLGALLSEGYFTGDYSEGDFNRKKAQLQQEFSGDTTNVRDIDIALSSGDPTVIAAWQECMRNSGGGVIFYMRSVGPQQAFATLGLLPALGVTNARLTSDVSLPPGVTATTGAACLKRNYRIVATASCEVTLQITDPAKPVALSLNTSAGGANAYLAPRLVWTRETLPYTLPDLSYSYKGVQPHHDASVSAALPEDLVQKGWNYDPTSFKITLNILRAFKGSGCDNLQSSATPFEVSYSYSHHALDASSTTSCSVTVSINLIRDRWMKAGGSNQLPTPLAVGERISLR